MRRPAKHAPRIAPSRRNHLVAEVARLGSVGLPAAQLGRVRFGTPAETRLPREFAAAAIARCTLACLGLLSLPGCYDAEALIQQTRAAAIQDRLEEVDLGEYRVTLPPADGTSTHGVVAFHAFGLVAHQHRDEVVASLETRGPEFDHQMLLAIRRLTLEEVEDPELNALRGSIAEAVNRPFSEPLVRRVGFYKFNFMPL